jgi:hypothetical protein
VTRPLRELTQAVSTLSARGLDEGHLSTPQAPEPPAGRDEFGRLRRPSR